jgi:hypothetical protein
VPYRDGKWLETGFTLVNDAPFPVTVDEIGLPDPAGSRDPFSQIHVSMNAPAVEPWGPGIPDQMVRFRPFTLPSHDARFILVRYEFSGCSLTQSQEDLVLKATQLVRFRMRIGWVTIRRSDLLPLPYSIAVSGNEGCAG